MSINKPLQAVALMGATGSGKSALAIELASQHDTCIISCDSMQVYRGLDIGTAKPTKEEQQQVRHALIDCTDVSTIWSAQTWVDAAREVIAQENKQGNLPIIVGGTGLYLKALLEGFAQVPAEKEGVRESFEALQLEKGVSYLYDQLLQVDETLAKRLKPQDSQRIIRGLSVFKSTGLPLSVWHQEQDKAKQAASDSLDCSVYVLEKPRELLRERIALRFEQMMEQGWVAETEWLKSLNLPNTHPVMRAVGYRQLLDHLEGQCTLEEAIRDGITATRRYAKRQRTWFNNQTPDAERGDAKEMAKSLNQVFKQTIVN